MRQLIIMLILLSIPAIGISKTITVPGDFTTIQQAIDAAENGDTVLVEKGTYQENINFKKKAITVKSSDGVTSTVIDGMKMNSVVTFQSGEEPDSVLDGFTITNGHSSLGGGIRCTNSSPTIINNNLSGNSAAGAWHEGGGGMCNDLNSSPIVSHCTFSGNSTFGDSIGCGMFNREGGSPTVSCCIFNGNYGGRGGGGIFNWKGEPIITSCIFSGNSVKEDGGGVCNDGNSTMITNCTFHGNTANKWGGGIAAWSAKLTVANCIIWSNTAPSGPEIGIYGADIFTISHSDVKGGKASVYVNPVGTLNWGYGMIDTDPLFVDPANNDFHLTFPSPCKDTGDNSVVSELYDFEGDPLIAYGTVDMGADEFYTHLYWTGDATPGGNVEVKFVGLPGTAPVGLFLGAGVLDPPIKSMWGDWHLQFPIIGPIGMQQVPATGVLIMTGTLPATPPPPYSIPMQGLIGAELTNLSVMEIR